MFVTKLTCLKYYFTKFYIENWENESNTVVLLWRKIQNNFFKLLSYNFSNESFNVLKTKRLKVCKIT